MAVGSRESVFAVVGAVAGVVGAVAAVAVFVLPSADARQGDREGGVASPQAGSPSVSASVSPSASSPAPADERALAAMTPATGAGAVTVEGDDLVMECPGNQSDDRYREVRYDLLAPYRRLEAGVAVSGPGDPDATAAVQVFVRRRQDRSDRVVEVGRSVVHSGQPGSLAVPLDDAASLVLRVTCMVTTQTVKLTNPAISR